MSLSRGRWAVCLALLALLLIACARSSAAPAEEQPKEPKRIAQLVRIPLPITGQTFERTRQSVRRGIEKAKREEARLVLIVELKVPKGQKDFGRGSDFGASYALANFLSSDELNAVRTVAYIPQPIQGHAVLPALACQEIIMAKEGASIGAAGIDEKHLNKTVRSAYAEIAGRRRTVPPVVALAMLDPSVEVLQVETDKLATEFVTPEELQKLKQEHATKEPVMVKQAGQLAEFTSTDARRFGFAKYLASDRRELLKALDLPATALEDDLGAGGWRAVRVDLKGPIRADNIDQAQRIIEEQRREHDANFICLWIDSPGGSIGDSMRLANFLAFDLDPATVRTVAYVPNEARSDAALIALACDQVVMHPRAVIGGPGSGELTAEDVGDARQVVQKKLAPRKGRSWSLVAAMIDPNLNVFRATRLGDVEYFSDEEIKEQLEPEKWQKDVLVTVPGTPLKLTGAQAEQYRLVNHTVDSFAQFRQLYGLEDDPRLVEPGWADFLIRALASPGVAVLLLIIGLAGLYIELHSPGLGVGGFVAAVCFLLFFWSRYLGGTATWLEAILFLAGVACLLLEIFVLPGFGIFGLGGAALVIVSLVLASQTFIWPQNEYQFEQLETSLLTLVAAFLGLIVVVFVLRSRLPRSRMFGNMMLEPPAGDEAETIRRRESLVDFHNLVGAKGVTTTQLTPGGKARFGDLLVDVLADGEVIPRGAAIEVVEVRGNRVLVKQAES